MRTVQELEHELDDLRRRDQAGFNRLQQELSGEIGARCRLEEELAKLRKEIDENERCQLDELEELENIFGLDNGGSIGSQVMAAARKSVADLAEAKDRLCHAFLAGAKWWEWEKTNATMWQSDQNEVFAEALNRYPFLSLLERGLRRELEHANALNAQQAERIKELEAVLDTLARLGNEPHFGNSRGNVIAQNAIAAKEPA